MNRLYAWITKANQVLLFFSMIGLVLALSYVFYIDYLRRRVFEPPHVAIAQGAEDAKASYVEEVRLLEEYDGIFVFGMMKRVILDEASQRRLLASTLGNEEAADPGQVVNVVFSRAGQPVTKLLENDGLVLSHSIAKHNSEKLNGSVFVCVSEDTDGNHQLDEKDRQDLYVLAENLETPPLVMKGISGYRIVSPTHMAVKTKERDAIHYWDVDIESHAKTEIPWK